MLVVGGVVVLVVGGVVVALGHTGTSKVGIGGPALLSAGKTMQYFICDPRSFSVKLCDVVLCAMTRSEPVATLMSVVIEGIEPMPEGGGLIESAGAGASDGAGAANSIAPEPTAPFETVGELAACGVSPPSRERSVRTSAYTLPNANST